MGFFYTTRFENKNNKRYLVLRPIPQRMYIHLVLIALLLTTVYMKTFYQKYLDGYYLTFAFTIMGIFALCIILHSIDQLRAAIARFKKKEVITRGGTTIFNSKNPPEIWIEQ